MFLRTILASTCVALCVIPSSIAQNLALTHHETSQKASPGNRPERLDWFRNQGFGIFIHWSVDGQLGTVISHSLVDASPEYTQKFFHALPETFAPHRFDADSIARLIRISGARYMVFTTKHHSGFAMFPTATTDFNVMNTPFHRDITGELFNSVRRQGLATGVYFSPDDFHWLYEHHIAINRNIPEVQFKANPGLLRYDQQQVRELLTHYAPVDMIFFDGEAQGLRELAWSLKPKIVVTRGAITTPEQYIPGAPLEGPWEANITMGTAWQYQPQHEVYKSGPELIRALIETRARGGNLLLNIGIKPNGEVPIEQEDRLREIGLWMFVNGEAIYDVRPWNITNEGDVWFTQRQSGSDSDFTLYAIVDSPWQRGKAIDLILHSVRSTPATIVSVLGANSRVYEYEPQRDPSPTWQQQDDGLHLHATRTQRLQDNSAWPNPAVLKITHVRQGFVAPVAITGVAHIGKLDTVLHGSWSAGDKAGPVEVYFEYRTVTGEDTNSRSAVWTATTPHSVDTPSEVTETLHGLTPGEYEFRFVVKHPLLSINGNQQRFSIAP